MTASLLLWCRLASALLVIVIAMPSRLAASDMTPPVNRYLLLQDVELGAEAAEQLRKQVPLPSSRKDYRINVSLKTCGLKRAGLNK